MSNNKVQLTGFLGEDAKAIHKEGKSYVVLNLATKDGFPIKQNGETTWHQKETVWHDVFVFRPVAAKLASGLKKSDKVDIVGSISYKQFKDERGGSRRQALIEGYFIDKIDYNKQESLFAKELVEGLAKSLKSSGN